MNKKISKEQSQTKETFGFKWKKRDTYESENMQKEWKRWLLEKYFDSDETNLSLLMEGGKKRILDAGCGSGGSGMLLFEKYLNTHEYVGVDISDAVEVGKKRFKEKGYDAEFYQSDLNEIPEKLGKFDIIFSEGVLHHTDSVEKAIFNVSKHLKPNGHFLFYVYSKKAPIREYTDDYIRSAISELNDEDAWDEINSLTKLGEALGNLNIEIDIKEEIKFLHIPKGKINLQRLFYYKIFKCFYRNDYTLDEMNHINFDWYRPKNCHRHTPDEVRQFCSKANLEIERINIEDSGITIIAKPILNKK